MLYERKFQLLKTFLQNHSRIVLDFTFIANAAGSDAVEAFADVLSECGCQVAVTNEFYEDMDVMRQGGREEQNNLLALTDRLMEQLRSRKSWFRFDKVYSAGQVLGVLGDNPEVAFAFYVRSEFAEAVLESADSIRAGLLVVRDDGSFGALEGPEEIRSVLSPEIDPEVLKTGTIKIEKLPDTGSRVFTRGGSEIVLGELVGQGGEGKVFRCREKGTMSQKHVVKIFHTGMLDILRLKKLRMMEQADICFEGICWPEKMVFTSDGRPAGYLMSTGNGKDAYTVFSGPGKVKTLFPSWTRKDLVRLCIQILQRYQYLHIYGILVGDMRLKNLYVGLDGVPGIMDIDSAQIRGIPCPVGFEDFTPPELIGRSFRNSLRTFRNESYSVAVLIFEIFFFGLHPYDQIDGAETLAEDMKKLNFPYPGPGEFDYSRIPWGGYDEIWKNMPVQLQTFFCRVFRDGERFSLGEMICLLRTYERFIEQTSVSYPLAERLVYREETDL